MHEETTLLACGVSRTSPYWGPVRAPAARGSSLIVRRDLRDQSGSRASGAGRPVVRGGLVRLRVLLSGGKGAIHGLFRAQEGGSYMASALVRAGASSASAVFRKGRFAPSRHLADGSPAAAGAAA
jgi:hypothetical protein